MIRRRVLALATAAALVMSPVSIANAQENLGELSAAVGSAEGNNNKASSELTASSNKATGKKTNQGENSSVIGITGDPAQDFFIDLAIALGVWMVLGSIYGSFIAPHLPHFSLMGLLPS
ncbi:MAG: family 17 glucosidase [Corynebacterium sp.]|nr:family 17 glucosidase [Corynebacterium sp.]